MPRIPIYQQQVVANSQLSDHRFSGQAIRAISDNGLDNLARGLGSVASGQAKQAIDQAETESRVWAANASSQADLAMAERMQQLQSTAQPGASGFTPGYLKDFDKYTDDVVRSAPSEHARNMIRAHMAGSREAFGRSALAFEAGERARYAGQQIDDGLRASTTIVGTNPAWFDREMGKWNSVISSVQLPADAKAKLRDNARRSLVNAAVISWIDSNSRQASEILNDIKRGDEPFPDVKWSDSNGTYSVPVKLGTFDERMKWSEYANKKLNDVKQNSAVALRYEVQNAEAMAKTGTVPGGPERTINEFLAAFDNENQANHEFARYTTARQTAQAVANMSGMNSNELLAITQERPDANEPNFAVSSQNQAIRAGAAVQIINSRRADPVGHALFTGDFQLQPLDITNREHFSVELKKRFAAMPVMADKYGLADMLSKPEAQQLSKQLDLMPADQLVEELETIRSAIADNTVYGSLINSIRSDSPVTALVGNLAAIGERKNAELIASGERLLNPSKGVRLADGKTGSAFPMPSDMLLRDHWTSVVGNAYRGHPNAEATAYQAYRAYYAALSAKSGNATPNAVNSDFADEAVKAATGGVMRWDTAAFGNDTPSADIVLPYGMQPDVFKDMVAYEWLKLRQAHGYTKTDVDDIGLFNTGTNGEYLVISGKSWLPDKDGQPIVLKITANKPVSGLSFWLDVRGR